MDKFVSMNAISNLLVIYFIILSLIPCGDQYEAAVTGCSDEMAVMELQDVPVEDCSHQDECSPLCVCNCCNVHVVFPSNKISGFLKPFKVNSPELLLTIIPSPVFTIDYPPVS